MISKSGQSIEELKNYTCEVTQSLPQIEQYQIGVNFQSHILERWWSGNKMNPWGDLKSFCHMYLPVGLTMVLVKKALV